MVHGFALEPEMVATWGNREDYRYFFNKFGLGQPRLMVEYPKLKNWRRQVLRAMDGKGDIEKQKVTAILTILMEKVIARIPHSEYDGTHSWLENAENENAAIPFDAILASSNPRRNPSVLVGGRLGDVAEPLWDVEPDLPPVPRTAVEMANAVQALLRNSCEIVFVDPHFGPENSRHRRPLEAFLSKLVSSRGSSISSVTMLTSGKSARDFFSTECQTKLPRVIPKGLSVNFVQLEERPGGEKLHNRYILTEIGAVKFNIGLDDGNDGETEDISLMSRKNYDQRWAQYSGRSPAFTRVNEVTVVGTKA